MMFFQAVTAARLRSTTPSLVTTNLVAHWDPNTSGGYSGTTLYDLINSDDITLYNGAAVTLPFIEFDGVNDYGMISTDYAPSAVKFGYTSTFTWACWLRADFAADYGAGPSKRFVALGENSGNFATCGIVAGFSTTARRNLAFWLRASATQQEQITMGSAVDQFENYYIAFTYSGSRATASWKAYINGASDTITRSSTGTSTSAPSYSASTFSLGAQDNGTAAYLQGGIGAIHIYNRVLSASEILQNFNATKSDYGL